jgi:biopolymer transport protein TolR
MAFTAPSGRTQTALADINITPLVDVVLVLLIIFMVTAPVLQSGIEVSVPKTRTVKEISEERTVITINKDQRVFLGNDAININQIAARLRQKIRAISSSLSAPMRTCPSALSPPSWTRSSNPASPTSAS